MSKIALVVDDSAIIRRMVSQTLKGLGFEILEAANGQEALQQAKGKSLSLVITDVNMPVMSGIDFIRAVRQEPEHKFTPIVFFTTESDAKLRGEAKAAGATAWIVKPFQPEKVISVVQKIAA